MPSTITEIAGRDHRRALVSAVASAQAASAGGSIDFAAVLNELVGHGWRVISADHRPADVAQVLEAADQDVITIARRRRLAQLTELAAYAEQRGGSVLLVDFDNTTVVAGAAELDRLVSRRTREGLARRRAAGVKLGRPPARRTQLPEHVIERVIAEHQTGASLRTIADGLNSDHIPTAQGCTWHHSSVRQVLRAHLPAATEQDAQ